MVIVETLNFFAKSLTLIPELGEDFSNFSILLCRFCISSIEFFITDPPFDNYLIIY